VRANGSGRVQGHKGELIFFDAYCLNFSRRGSSYFVNIVKIISRRLSRRHTPRTLSETIRIEDIPGVRRFGKNPAKVHMFVYFDRCVAFPAIYKDVCFFHPSHPKNRPPKNYVIQELKTNSLTHGLLSALGKLSGCFVRPKLSGDHFSGGRMDKIQHKNTENTENTD